MKIWYLHEGCGDLDGFFDSLDKARDALVERNNYMLDSDDESFVHAYESWLESALDIEIVEVEVQ
jgi:hypothetical protein